MDYTIQYAMCRFDIIWSVSLLYGYFKILAVPNWATSLTCTKNSWSVTVSRTSVIHPFPCYYHSRSLEWILPCRAYTHNKYI
jgi:hypothetical protein